MSVDSDEYERFVAIILDGIKSSGRKISNLRHGRNNKILGASGQRHQIDVSFIDNSFNEPTLVLIECKRYDEEKYPIELDLVKVLKATLDDITQAFQKTKKSKAMLVTTAKVRQGAERYANYYGIVIEKLPHNKSFTFKYENFISAGVIISTGHMPLNFSSTLMRMCEKCGKQFEQIGEEKICLACKSTRD